MTWPAFSLIQMKLLKEPWSEIISDKEKNKINVQYKTIVKVFSKPVFYLT